MYMHICIYIAAVYISFGCVYVLRKRSAEKNRLSSNTLLRSAKKCKVILSPQHFISRTQV